MFNIDLFLKRFSKDLQSAELQKKQILEVIERHTQIKIVVSNVEVKNYIVYIKESPLVLNKIFINKNKILEDIARLIPASKIVDIR